MHVCICVYVQYMHVSMHVCTHVCVCMCVRVCVCMCMHVCTCEYVHVFSTLWYDGRSLKYQGGS